MHGPSRLTVVPAYVARISLTMIVVNRDDAERKTLVGVSRGEWAVFGLAVAVGLAIVALKLSSEFGPT